MRTLVLLCTLAGCWHGRTSAVPSAIVASSVPCASPRTFGAVPDDDLDDRGPLQATLDACAGQVVTLEAGEYLVKTPSPRPPGMYVMLAMRPGTTLEGVGKQTVLKFVGDNQKKDWVGLRPADDTVVRRVRMTNSFDPGTTAEQTHLIRILGPTTNVRIDHGSCYHPQSTTKVGDCIQITGYQNGKLVIDVEIDHWDFEHSGRSGIAVHGGLVGHLKPDGHSSTRFHDNHFGDISDNSIDGEGTGDGTDWVEIDHNVIDTPFNLESAVALEVMNWKRTWIHDNKIKRGMNLYGCDPCVLEHNEVVQSTLGAPNVFLRKAGSGTTFADETYVHDASGGPSAVIDLEQKVTAPDHVKLRDVRITQHAAAPAVKAIGIAGLDMRDLRVEYDGPAQDANRGFDAVSVSGAGSAGCPLTDPPSVRADEVVLLDSVVNGPFRAVVGTSGSYCGAGSFEIRRTSAIGPAQSIRCENTTVGAGVRGPVVVGDNALPPPLCAPLLP